MKILVTGAKGFVGKNLCSQLKNIKEGKARWYEGVQIEEIFEYDLGNTQEELDKFSGLTAKLGNMSEDKIIDGILKFHNKEN